MLRTQPKTKASRALLLAAGYDATSSDSSCSIGRSLHLGHRAGHYDGALGKCVLVGVISKKGLFSLGDMGDDLVVGPTMWFVEASQW